MKTISPAARSIREHDTCSLTLDPVTARSLRSPSLNGKLTITPDFRPDHYVIRTGAFVGRVVVPGLSLRITPKIGIRQLLSMIRPDRLAGGIGDQIDSYEPDDLADAVAALYQRSVADALARGIRRDYVQQEERLIALRGRIDMARQLRSATPSPIACRFEEYTIDNPHNRLLKAGLQRVLLLEGVTDRTRSTILRTLQWFGEVSDRPPPIAPLLRRGFGRLDRHYETPCRLAALILESSSLGDSTGELSANTFLVDMNKVFEEFVEDRLRRRLPPEIRLSAQVTSSLDLGGYVAIRPDLVFSRDGLDLLVADVKYKQPDDETGKETDLYQVIAYATALGLDRAMLIYATDVDRPDGNLAILGQRSVQIVHLNLTDGARTAEAGLRRISDALRHGAAAATADLVSVAATSRPATHSNGRG